MKGNEYNDIWSYNHDDCVVMKQVLQQMICSSYLCVGTTSASVSPDILPPDVVSSEGRTPEESPPQLSPSLLPALEKKLQESDLQSDEGRSNGHVVMHSLEHCPLSSYRILLLWTGVHASMVIVQ